MSNTRFKGSLSSALANDFYLKGHPGKQQGFYKNATYQ